MKEFDYTRPQSAATAVQVACGRRNAKYLGGGTNLVDLMRENIETPDALVDVSRLSQYIVETEDGGIRIGGAVTNTALAGDRRVRDRFPFLSAAILAGASGQIRNMATVAGNLLQRTRCGYFYDPAARCNKRVTDAGCDAIGGYNRYHAVLGTSQACIAAFPSDMCVALVALDTTVIVQGPNGKRSIAFESFHQLPGHTPQIETTLMPGELIVEIVINPYPQAGNSTYRKIRDRASYAFALVSIAAAVSVHEGVVDAVRIGLGGIAPKPWRAHRAEALLLGQAPTVENIRRAAEVEMQDAHGFGYNDFKIELTMRAMVEAIGDLARKGDLP